MSCVVAWEFLDLNADSQVELKTSLVRALVTVVIAPLSLDFSTHQRVPSPYTV